jgi:signal transduction histidine kinase
LANNNKIQYIKIIKKVSIKIKLLFAMLLIGILFIGIAINYVSQLKEDMILDNKEKLSDELKYSLKQKLQKKFDIAITNAVGLSSMADLKKSLKNNDRKIAIDLIKNINKKYKDNTNFKGINVHIHDKNGKSFLRSWKNDRYGDNLDFRESISNIRTTHKANVFFEIGKIGLRIRGLSAITSYDGEYLGSLEFIQGVGSVGRDFEKENRFYIMLLIPNNPQLPYENIKNNLKIDKYVIAHNKWFSDNIINFSKSLNYDYLLKNGYSSSNKYFTTYLPVTNAKSDVIAYHIIGTNINELTKNIDDIDYISNQLINLIILLILALLIITGIIFNEIIIKPLSLLQKGLNDFFDFLNHKKDSFKEIQIKDLDEIGKMINKINKTTKEIKNNTILDKKMVLSLNDIALDIERGILSKRISQKASNESLNELKNTMNRMLNSLEQNIGSDLCNIINILGSINNGDLDRTISNPTGELEKLMNVMIRSLRESRDVLTNQKDILESEVAKRTDELQEAFEEVESQKNNIERTLNDLRKTQDKLVESEKMAALGQLVAGIAHEINTPIGAIKSSSGNIKSDFEYIINNINRIITTLNKEQKDIFLNIINNTNQNFHVLSTREERTIRKNITNILKENNIEDANNIARKFLGMMITDEDKIMQYIPLLNNEESIDLAQKIINTKKSNDNISLAVDKASKVILALKTFSRYDDSGQMTLVSLKDSLETVLTIYNNQIKQGITLEKDIDELENICCFADELNQVWTNLIYNSLQAMKNQGILKISLKESQDYQIVSIQDNGCGIPENIKDKIFEPFFTTKKAGEGSGLGLDIVKKIIIKHDGKIELNTQENVGTEFKVYIKKKHNC